MSHMYDQRVLLTRTAQNVQYVYDRSKEDTGMSPNMSMCTETHTKHKCMAKVVQELRACRVLQHIDKTHNC